MTVEVERKSQWQLQKHRRFRPPPWKGKNVMSHTRNRIGIFSVLTLGLAVSGLLAATATQTFTVTVPSVLTVTRSGSSTVTITHDQSDSNNAFSAQQFVVHQNGVLGATISFAVAQPFTNGSFKRDCKLDLAIASSDSQAVWAVTTASSQTD